MVGSITATAAGINWLPAVCNTLSVSSGLGGSFNTARDSSHVRRPNWNSARTRVEVSVSFSTKSRSMA